MTTSVVFDDIDYSQIEYDANASVDEAMLTDPSASIIALQGLRILKTRETGDEVVVPDTIGRAENPMTNFNETSYEQYRMRRKAEVLKYNKNSTITKRTHYAALSLSRRGQLSNTSVVSSRCESDIIRVKPAINSGVKGDNSLLFYDQNVTFIEKL